jgi:hypothetical protein
MFKLSCSYKDQPAVSGGFYRVQVVEGRCRVFSVCLGDPSAAIETPGTKSEVKLYTSDYTSGNFKLSIYANQNAAFAPRSIASYVDFPSEGVLFEDGVYVDMNDASMTGIAIFHNGGVTA